MGIENLNNEEMGGKRELSKDELELEFHAGPIKEGKIPATTEEFHKHAMGATASTGLFELEKSENGDFQKKVEEIVKEIPITAKPIVSEEEKRFEQERNEGDLGHLMMLEKKLEHIKQYIADNKDEKLIAEAKEELAKTQQEYDIFFKEYSERVKQSVSKQ
ncbi:MAG TPA: hypothetical protein PLQ44_01665 [Candidatus Paceibacterota bacterium]|nr:hypothetical protein [Candidatus Paceibacterota bacterium]HPT40293.1 hypothetical protein [Candidatus Paceibacterota bacterium]